MHWIDWTILFLSVSLVVSAAHRTRKYTRSVAHFLAAERCVKRYLLSISEGIAFCGAVAVIALFEMYYKGGFPAAWWGWIYGITSYVIILSGWVIYRFRATRSLTLGEFFEKRYSRKFRIVAGSICFLSGLLNFGVFPGVGSRFFVYFCGFPTRISLGIFTVPTFALIMAIILVISVLLTFWGGQIAVIVADYLQGAFSNIVFLLILGWLLYRIDWSHFRVLYDRPPGQSLVNPFDTGQIKNFNVWYFLIGAFGLLYNWMGFQGAQAYNACAKSAHESRMGRILGVFRGQGQALFFLVVPLCAYVVLTHPDYSTDAAAIHNVLRGIANPEEQFQMITPMTLKQLLPTGFLGLFAAMMIAALLSTHDSYLHSWASICIQDIILPLRKKPLTPVQHMFLLRLAVVAVAVFVFFFSLFYHQVQHLMLYFAITGAIFLGGSGAVLVGGLYWKRGTTAAAFCSMIIGSSIAICGILLNQFIENFWIDGQWFYLISMVVSIAVYVIVSLVGKKKTVNMDRLLHRGPHALSDDVVVGQPKNINRFYRIIGITVEFTLGDRLIYYGTIALTALLALAFLTGTLCHFLFGMTGPSWLKFWFGFTAAMFLLSAASTVWITVCGAFDVNSLFRDVRAAKIDVHDDGTVNSPLDTTHSLSE